MHLPSHCLLFICVHTITVKIKRKTTAVNKTTFYNISRIQFSIRISMEHLWKILRNISTHSNEKPSIL